MINEETSEEIGERSFRTKDRMEMDDQTLEISMNASTYNIVDTTKSQQKLFMSPSAFKNACMESAEYIMKNSQE